MPAPTIKTITFTATYRHGVDDKRRVQMPFRWRFEKDMDLTLMVWPQHRMGTCLRGLPPEQLGKLRQEIELMANAEKNILKRRLGNDSAVVTLDSAGRFQIPEEMAEAAGIKDTAVLAGNFDFFEVWNPDTYKKVTAFDAPQATLLLEKME